MMLAVYSDPTKVVIVLEELNGEQHGMVVICGVVRCGVVWCGVGLRLGLA